MWYDLTITVKAIGAHWGKSEWWPTGVAEWWPTGVAKRYGLPRRDKMSRTCGMCSHLAWCEEHEASGVDLKCMRRLEDEQAKEV
jgi:hypothetical protein